VFTFNLSFWQPLNPSSFDLTNIDKTNWAAFKSWLWVICTLGLKPQSKGWEWAQLQQKLQQNSEFTVQCEICVMLQHSSPYQHSATSLCNIPILNTCIYTGHRIICLHYKQWQQNDGSLTLHHYISLAAGIIAAETRVALSYSARGYDSAVCCSKMWYEWSALWSR